LAWLASAGCAASFDAMAKEAEAACQPVADVVDLEHAFEAHRAGNACLGRILAADLRAARAARGVSASAWIDADAASFAVFHAAFAEVVERRRPFDVLDVGWRTGDGAGCTTAAIEERIAYAHWLAQADARALAARVRAVAPLAAATHAAFAQIADLERAVRARPSEARVIDAFAHVVALTGEVERRAGDLARSTCAGFPGLAATLGGGAVCEAEVARYYLAHCRV
jgi:hypothetical protein